MQYFAYRKELKLHFYLTHNIDDNLFNANLYAQFSIQISQYTVFLI